MIRPDIHPTWCGRGHVCTAGGPRGEHRSHPETIDTPAGRLVLTRIQTRAGRARMEIRAVVDLPADPAAAQSRAQLVVYRLCRAINPRRLEATTR